MSIEIYQQWDMFSGEQVEVGRSRPQPLYQKALFSTPEMVEMGANARTWLKDMPTPTLELEYQDTDTRTEEEKERDLMREVEKLTAPMFETPPLPTGVEPTAPAVLETVLVEEDESQSLLLDQDTNYMGSAENTNGEDEEGREQSSASVISSLSKYECFLALVHAAEEQAAILENTPASALSGTMTMSKTKLEARLAGLTDEEMAAALTIGEFRGRATRPSNHAEAIVPTETPKEQNLQRAAEALPQPTVTVPSTRPTSQPEARAEAVQEMDEPIPVAWVSKSALVTCRPDLGERIQDLNTADMVLIAKRVREVLETNYQMALDVTLTEYLDVGETPDDDE